MSKPFHFISYSEAKRIAAVNPFKVAESHMLLQREIEELREKIKTLEGAKDEKSQPNLASNVSGDARTANDSD